MTRPGVEVRGRKSGLGSHQATVGDSVEWYTPAGIFLALGLVFDLDVCAPPGGLPWIPAARFYCEADDGLTQPWDGLVWMNPPYGRHIGAWMRRLAAHGNGMALVPGRTDTEWYHDTAPSALAKCELNGRVTFVDSEQRPGKFNSGAPSIMLAYGETCAAALDACGLGLVVPMPGRPLAGQPALFEAV